MKLVLLAGLLLATIGSAIAQIDPNRVVATVNGVAIKGSEYYRRMEFLPGVGKNLGDGFAEFPPGFLTLEQLITEKLIFQLAKEKGVSPSTDQIQDEYQYRLSKNPDMLKDWLATGQTKDELEYQIKFDLAQFNLLTAGINVTDQEVDSYYNDAANKAKFFTTPDEVGLKVIVVRSQADADAVDKELAAGKDFGEVAKAHSADITAKAGGEYGTIPLERLSGEVQGAIKALKPGQTTQWFKSAPNQGSNEPAAMFKFLVEKFTPSKVLPLDADLRRQIRMKLMMDKGKIKNPLKKELDALRAKANIDIGEKGFADAYKKFMDAYLKASAGGN